MCAFVRIIRICLTMAMISRRGFVGGALAVGGAAILPSGAFAAATPRLTFGVVSDIHIGGKPDAEEQLEKVLRWFAE